MVPKRVIRPPVRAAPTLSSGYRRTPGQPDTGVRLCNLNCAGE
jgi:hypothetical protein